MMNVADSETNARVEGTGTGALANSESEVSACLHYTSCFTECVVFTVNVQVQFTSIYNLLIYAKASVRSAALSTPP